MFGASIILRLYFCAIVASQSLTEANLSHRNDEDLSFLLQNVNHIWMVGALGWISVFGENAFPVVAAEANGSPGIYKTLIAGARYGTGRIIAAPHDGFLYFETPPVPNDRDQFLLNIVNWLSPGQHATRIATIRTLQPEINSIFESQGIQVSAIDFTDISNASVIANYDALLIRDHIPKDVVPHLMTYLEFGRGLLTSPTAWSYSCCSNGEKFGSEYPGNILTSKAGFAISQGYGVGPTTPMSTYNTTQEYVKYLHFNEALQELQNYKNGVVGDDGKNIDRSRSVMWGVMSTVSKVNIWAEKSLYDSIQKITRPEDQPIPTETNPVSKRKDKVNLEIFHVCSSLLKPQDVKIHPASIHFPGEVPQSSKSQFHVPEVHTVVIEVKKFSTTVFETADFVLREKEIYDNITFPDKRYRWFSTGLYAPAGDVITVNARSEDLFVFSVQIGSHTDILQFHNEYKRLPWAVVSEVAENKSVEMASPYGGLIYINIPAGTREGNLTVTIQGGRKAPFFKLGETSVEDWQETIRYRSVPWTEFANDKLVITVPTIDAVLVDDPEKLMRLWLLISDAYSDLAGTAPNSFDERFVSDVQISSGNMHSGYPVMTLLDAGKGAINFTDLLTYGSWDHFHELGHNHQNDDWTFSGTGDTTCNIFALFVFDTILGIPLGDAIYHLRPENYQPRVRSYIARDRDFNFWKSDPAFSLVFYYQIQQNFGWYIYKSVFRMYRELGSSERPKTDQDKMDLWLIMLSKSIEKDLLQFFYTWGFPISDKARNDLKQLGYPNANILMDDLL